MIVGEIVFAFPPTYLPPPVITYLITAWLFQPCCHPNEMVSPTIGADLGVLCGITQCGRLSVLKGHLLAKRMSTNPGNS